MTMCDNCLSNNNIDLCLETKCDHKESFAFKTINSFFEEQSEDYQNLHSYFFKRIERINEMRKNLENDNMRFVNKYDVIKELEKLLYVQCG